VVTDSTDLKAQRMQYNQWLKKGTDELPGHLIDRKKGGRTAELQAVTAAEARSIRFFMTAGLMNAHSGPAALPGSLHRGISFWPTAAGRRTS
jgi:hypothetical protein